MRIEFELDGGLAYMPGLAAPALIDVDQLPAAEVREIREVVAAARFFSRPAPAPASSRAGADRRSYTITITDDGERRKMTVTEPIEDEPLRRLVRAIEEQARAARRWATGRQTP